MEPELSENNFLGEWYLLLWRHWGIPGVLGVAAGLALSRGTKWLTVAVVRSAVVAGGLLIVALALIGEFAVAIAIVALLGIILSLCSVGAQILIQTQVSDGMRGRVSSFWGMIAFGGTSLGSLIIGAAASAWGLQAAVAGAGVICALVSLVTLRRGA